MPAFGTRPGNFQNTPLMIDDVLYVHDDIPPSPSTPRPARSLVVRSEVLRRRAAAERDGVRAPRWPRRDAGRLRIFLASRYRLICLDAKTGEPVSSFFGEKGIVDLTQGLLACQQAALHEHVADRTGTQSSSGTAW